MRAQTERWIAISVIAMSLILIAVLAMVLGKFSVATSERVMKVRFSSVTGININSPVKFAGAPVGRVHGIRVLPRNQQEVKGRELYCVELELLVDPKLELGSDIAVSIRQDGVLGSKFVSITPGAIAAPQLAYDKVLDGESPVELSDLAAPAQQLIKDLQPAVANLSRISFAIEQSIPNLMMQLDQLLANGNLVMQSASTPEGREQIRQLLSNLKVVSDNLKVVTTHAKGITSTLGEKPWRLIWGGEPNKLPTEQEILQSTKALPVKKADTEEVEFRAEKQKSKKGQEQSR